jgi:hypothetical protein
MPRTQKAFEEYLLPEDARSQKYVNQSTYFKSPATAFLKYTVEAKDAVNMCINHFPKRTSKVYTQAAVDSLRYLVIALLPAIMGHFETFEKVLFAGMYENSVYLKNFDLRRFQNKLADAAEKAITIDLNGLSPYRNVSDFSVGIMLADSLKNWSSPEIVNKYFRCFVNYDLFSKDHIKQLLVLWQLRHSIVHNGGTITRADAQKVKALNHFSNQNILLDSNFIYEVSRKMHNIVKTSTCGIGSKYIADLDTTIKPEVLNKIKTFFEVKSSIAVWLR